MSFFSLIILRMNAQNCAIVNKLVKTFFLKMLPVLFSNAFSQLPSYV